MSESSQEISADNAIVKDVAMQRTIIEKGAMVIGDVINQYVIQGDPREKFVGRNGVISDMDDFGPHLEFDRDEQWESVKAVFDSEEHRFLFLLGERGQAHDRFVDRLVRVLSQDSQRNCQVCVVKWDPDTELTEARLRRALGSALKISKNDELPDDAAIAEALRDANAARPLVLLHRRVHADRQDPAGLRSLRWYYAKFLPERIAASRSASRAGPAGQVVVLQPIEWTSGLKGLRNFWSWWGLSPRAKVHALLQHLRATPTAPFMLKELPALTAIPPKKRRAMLSVFLRRFEFRGGELEKVVNSLMKIDTTEELFRELRNVWINWKVSKADVRVP